MHQYTTRGHNEDSPTWYSDTFCKYVYRQWLCSEHDIHNLSHKDKPLFCEAIAHKWVKIPGLCLNHVGNLHLWQKATSLSNEGVVVSLGSEGSKLVEDSLSR